MVCATDHKTEQHLKMKHLAAYLLLGLGGNTNPSKSDITSLLETVGIDADEERVDKLLEELDGKDINVVGSTLSGSKIYNLTLKS